MPAERSAIRTRGPSRRFVGVGHCGPPCGPLGGALGGGSAEVRYLHADPAGVAADVPDNDGRHLVLPVEDRDGAHADELLVGVPVAGGEVGAAPVGGIRESVQAKEGEEAVGEGVLGPEEAPEAVVVVAGAVVRAAPASPPVVAVRDGLIVLALEAAEALVGAAVGVRVAVALATGEPRALADIGQRVAAGRRGGGGGVLDVLSTALLRLLLVVVVLVLVSVVVLVVVLVVLQAAGLGLGRGMGMGMGLHPPQDGTAHGLGLGLGADRRRQNYRRSRSDARPPPPPRGGA